MPVKRTIKPYCYLKPLDCVCRSIYLHDAETTRISRDGRIVLPIEDPEFIHIRVRPDVATKTLSAIYVSNFKGCWINGCMALCWYKYTLNHGHIIRLQADCYEYQVTFFPPPKPVSVIDYLQLKIPKSLTEIPKKVMDEIVCEAKNEFLEERNERLKAKERLTEELGGGGEKKIEEKPTVKRKSKAIAKKKKKQKKKCKVKKLKKPPKLETPTQPLTKHVHFKTRSKAPTFSDVEEEVSKTIDYLATTAIQTTDSSFIPPSSSHLRKVIFRPDTQRFKKTAEKSVKFVAEVESVKSVVIKEPAARTDYGDDDEDFDLLEVEPSRSGIFEMVLELYDRMREEEREYKTDKYFAMYLLDKILRKMYKLKMADLTFMRELLNDVVEDAVTMKAKNLQMAKRVIDDVVDHVFVEKRKQIHGGLIEEILTEIFARIREPEAKVKKSETVEVVPSKSSSDDEDSEKSAGDEENNLPVQKVVYLID